MLAVQADLNLCWMHMPKGMISDVVVHMFKAVKTTFQNLRMNHLRAFYVCHNQKFVAFTILVFRFNNLISLDQHKVLYFSTKLN